ncbi:MAG: uncharacterized protein QOI74_2646 [Micromonosporaceae bacterium]|nr:uncharacterized protein [Micromonosporaceae bacterium]
MPNRLASSISPYLQQHQDNPVDWWPWCAEALAEARRRDVPLLISVGYAACHWCHVMAHESFERDDIAAVVNEACVPVKVDREERPDVDAVYMAATQAMTGQGGWPMTVFATPDGEPFLCGTYFPPANFVRLVQAVSQAWRDNREAVLRQGTAVLTALQPRLAGSDGAEPAAAGLTAAALDAPTLDAAAAVLSRDYDSEHAGFGGAPKFPPHLNLLFLLRHHQRTGSARSLEIVRHTCAAMARGGIYDQLAGGFARYSVDRAWTVPHFEKMLYDNALLLRVYTQLWRLTGDELALRVARRTTDFLLAEMRTSGGGFAAALDADTEGVEGATYVWTPDQLRSALGDSDGEWAATLLNVTDEGSFEEGTSVLRLLAEPDDPDRWERVRGRLLATRAGRAQPARDDKVVASWNGLVVTALVEYLSIIGDQETNARVVEAAMCQAGLALADHFVDGRLRRVSRDGVVGEPAAVLDDHGAVAEAFCALHQYSGEGRWLELAGRLLDTALEHFGDGSGGFFDTADDAEALFTRPADATDNATPSGLSTVATALITYAALTGQTKYREIAEAALARLAPVAAQYPRFAGYACAAGEALLSGPYEVAIVGGSDIAPLLAAAWRAAPPGAVIVAGEPDADGVPLLAGRPALDGKATAYVCRGFVCDAPVTSVEELLATFGR